MVARFMIYPALARTRDGPPRAELVMALKVKRIKRSSAASVDVSYTAAPKSVFRAAGVSTFTCISMCYAFWHMACTYTPVRTIFRSGPEMRFL